MYKIEKDIPVPPARTNISKADSKLKDILETLRELEIDHCFLIPMSVDDKDKREVNVLRSKIAYAKRILKHREKKNIEKLGGKNNGRKKTSRKSYQWS